MHFWRRGLLRIFGAKISRTARIYSGARVWYPPNLEMKDGSVLAGGVICYCQGQVTLEEFAVVSQFSHLVTGTHNIDEPGFQLETRPIVIGRHAWVAANAFIGPGVRVGEGAVVGACAVAFKSIPDWEVHVGNPAKYVRMRSRV